MEDKTKAILFDFQNRENNKRIRQAIKIKIGENASENKEYFESQALAHLSIWAEEILPKLGYTIEDVDFREAEYDYKHALGVAIDVICKRDEDAKAIINIVWKYEKVCEALNEEIRKTKSTFWHKLGEVLFYRIF